MDARGKTIVVLFILCLLFLSDSTLSYAEEQCLMCHEELTKGKTVHQAISMGCEICHSSLNVEDIPHKVTGNAPKGLSSEPPELCYNCHDKGIFSDKVIHPALQMGCTSCHNPHSSKNERLLNSQIPDICYNCHDKGGFENKVIHPALQMGCTSCHNPHSSKNERLLNSQIPDICFGCHDKGNFNKEDIHMPVAGGMCISCHTPHAGTVESLLNKGLNGLCLDCHSGLTGRHVIVGFGGKYHPVEGKPDPSSPGKDLTCVSCHNPHSSDVPRLLQQKRICQRCHKF